MESLNCDLGEYGRHKFLVVVDRATTFLWSKEVATMILKNTVAMLTSIFSTFGRPLEIQSDNGPAFRQTYEKAMADMGIDVQYSSAYHPLGNGMDKQAVFCLKMAIKKNGLGVGNQHLQDLVSSLNNQSSSMPGAGMTYERLLGYTLRFNLPLISRCMSPSQREGMLESLRERRDQSSRKFKNCRNKEFAEGRRVRPSQ